MKFQNWELIIISLAAVILLGLGSMLVQSRIKAETQKDMGKSLSAVLATTRQAVHSWAEEQKSAALVWANTAEVRRYTEDLLLSNSSPQALIQLPAQANLRSWFRPIQKERNYQGFFIISPDYINLASTRDENVGEPSLLVRQGNFLKKIRVSEGLL